MQQETDLLVRLDVKPGAFMESQSGIQRNRPMIYCRQKAPAGRPSVAFVLVHPTSNFHGHYLIDPLVARGAAVLAVNTRYVGNDAMLLMERALLDLGAGIRHLRDSGYEKVVLIGNSGGGSLAAFYQSQAEELRFRATPDGRPVGAEPADLPAADAIALVCAHPGRADQLSSKIDASVSDETDSSSLIGDLDMYAPDNGPPYDRAWLERYRMAQKARLDRITARVVARIATLEAQRPAATADEVFVIHRTQADPRLLDLSLDSNDRVAGSIQGPAVDANYAPNGLARFCTLRSFLSQWSPAHSRANGPARLKETSCPVLVVEHSADQTVFPSHIAAWRAACAGREAFHRLVGAPHYLDRHPDMIDELANVLIEWGTPAA